MEDAADGPQLLHVVRLLAPGGQQLFEVADFFLEFLQENFADLVVDLVAGAVETTDDRQPGAGGGDYGHRLGLGRRLGRRGFGLVGLHRFRLEGRLGRGLFRRGKFGRQLEVDAKVRVGGFFRRRGLRFRGRFRHRLGFGGPFGHRLGRRFGGRRRHHRRRRSQVFGRQRPVTQRLEVLARDFKDLFALGTTVAQRFEVILQARQRVGQAVHLLAVGHAAAAQQFAFGELAHGGQVLRRVLDFQDAQGAGDFFDKARHVGQLGVVPVGFDEGDKTLAGLGEVGDRFLDQHFQHLPRFAAGQRAFGGGLFVRGIGLAEAGDLVVERSFDVKQGAGDVEQGRFVGLALTAGDGVHGGALVLHHAARHAQAQHAQGVGNAVEGLGLFAQVGGRGARRAQVQVERVLDPQQVFLDGAGNGGQQRLVAAAEAAAGVRELGFAGHVLAQAEHFADFADAATFGGGMGDEIEQLAGQFQRRVAAESGVAAFGQSLDFLFDLGQRLLERLAGFERALGQGVERAGGHPEQAARVFGVGDRHQLFADVGEVADGVGAVVVLEPAQQRRLEQAAHGVGAASQFVFGQGFGRAGRGNRQRARQVGREQHRLRKALLAARFAQFVEQRQQHDRNVAVARLQAFKVIGQLHDAAHQRGVADVAVGNLAFLQRLGQLLHFFGHHGGAVEFDHAQGALHLVQERGAGLELARVFAFFDVGLKGLPRLAQRFVELGLDPGERGEIYVFVQPHAEVLSRQGRPGGRPCRCVARGGPGRVINPAA